MINRLTGHHEILQTNIEFLVFTSAKVTPTLVVLLPTQIIQVKVKVDGMNLPM